MQAVTDECYVLTGNGHRLYVDPGDARAAELLRAQGTLSPGSSRLWEAALAIEEWNVVVDIGANYGEMVLGAPLPEKARIVCFEPNPRVLPFLRRSIQESGMQIDLREVAVGATTTEATFVLDAVWSGRSGLESTHRTDVDHRLDSVVVPVRPLDQELALDKDSSVCVKVDVEGAEFDVLKGAHGLLESGRRWAIMVEVLHMDAFEKAQLAHEFTMRVMDRRTGNLIVVPPASAHRVSDLLQSGWVYPQDALLTARAVA